MIYKPWENSAWLAEIRQRAASLSERSAIDSRVWRTQGLEEAWCQATELTQEDFTVRRQLEVCPPHSQQDWTAELTTLMNGIERAEPTHIYNPHVPFSDCLSRLAAVGLAGLPKDVAETEFLKRSTDTVRGALVQTLSSICGPTLMHEFALAQSSDIFSRLAARSPESTAAISDFNRNLDADQWSDLIGRYPCLGRLVVQTLRQFRTNLSCLVRDLAQDKEALAETLGTPAEFRIVGMGLSDAHDGGKSVSAIQLDHGPIVYHKPRPVGIEGVWQHICQILDDCGAPVQLRAPECLIRDGYGWSIGVEQKPCQGEEEATQFFYSAGVLICLLRQLSGLDFHSENLIASGADPVVVDLEGLFHPTLDIPDVSAENPLRERLLDSVIATGLLPTWLLGDSDMIADVSALGNASLSVVRGSVWQNVNTDAMRLIQAEQQLPERANTVYVGNVKQHSADWMPTILRGFRDAAEFWNRAGDKVLNQLPPTDDIIGRFLFRPTSRYARCIEVSLRPEKLQDGIARSLCYERMYTKFAPHQASSHYLALVADEIRQLERLDIPVFWHRLGSRDITSPNGTVLQGMATPALDDLDERKSVDTGFECSVIAGSLMCSGDPHTDLAEHVGSLSSDAPADNETCLDFALEMGEELISHSDSGKGLHWLGTSMLPGATRIQLSAIGDDLFSGRAGIALFFAALAAQSGEETWIQRTHSVLQPLRRCIETAEADSILDYRPCSMATGWSGVVYALSIISELLQEPIWRQLAATASRRITDSDMREDRAYDLLLGAAGTVVALCQLGTEEALHRAQIAASHIERSAVWPAADKCAWPTLANRPQTGFSHGQSGIAYALDRLDFCTVSATYRKTVRAAIAFEDDHLIEDGSNWQDLRFDTQGVVAGSWCHGAPGIALARVACSHLLPEAVEEAVRRGINVSVKHGRGSTDQACCGTSGRISQLLSAASYLGEEQHRNTALQFASKLISRGSHSQRYFENTHGFPFVPGLFQGAAGIGHTMLSCLDRGQYKGFLVFGSIS
ncbi:MAG: hypothetical protein ETSY1_21995 [Candidatus Entotheonella factor]|uniref:Lantibiotic biosynthesis protein dehydration domain-containing protein n=1 Tax=Entotheonella factor TaxID=1429438 RepID=W4LIQ3_ENTF1|nr:MAG: hypothetical protein ETSY1_21995 [Candidatus Entotheonella factor]